MAIIEKGQAVQGRTNCERCGKEFEKNPKKRNHRFCCASCRTAAWSFRTAGSKILSAMQKDFDELEKRVSKLEGKKCD